jgi:hypothetical protein
MTDLTSAVTAGARAHFDRVQADRRDDGRKRPDGRPWQWDDLRLIDQHAYRTFVLPIVTAVLEESRCREDHPDPTDHPDAEEATK